VYEMYHWDQPDPAAVNGAEHPGQRAGGAGYRGRGARPAGLAGPAGPPGPARRRAGQAGGIRHTGPGRGTGPAAQAVQVALDRRDNGGDSGAPCDQ
jgi:hypothetical protein